MQITLYRKVCPVKWFLYAIKNSFKFEGRAARPEYWHFFFVALLIFIALLVLDVMVGGYDQRLGFGIFSGIFMMIILIPSIAVGARRLHDTDRSGWWQLVNFVPYVGSIVVVVLLLLRGQAEPNRYGPPPTHSAND